MKKFFIFVFAFFCWESAPLLYACSVCFGEQGTRQSNALGWAVGFLLLTVSLVLAGIGMVAVSWSRRAKKLSAEPQ